MATTSALMSNTFVRCEKPKKSANLTNDGISDDNRTTAWAVDQYLSAACVPCKCLKLGAFSSSSTSFA